MSNSQPWILFTIPAERINPHDENRVAGSALGLRTLNLCGHWHRQGVNTVQAPALLITVSSGWALYTRYSSTYGTCACCNRYSAFETTEPVYLNMISCFKPIGVSNHGPMCSRVHRSKKTWKTNWLEKRTHNTNIDAIQLVFVTLLHLLHFLLITQRKVATQCQRRQQRCEILTGSSLRTLQYAPPQLFFFEKAHSWSTHVYILFWK